MIFAIFVLLQLASVAADSRLRDTHLPKLLVESPASSPVESPASSPVESPALSPSTYTPDPNKVVRQTGYEDKKCKKRKEIAYYGPFTENACIQMPTPANGILYYQMSCSSLGALRSVYMDGECSMPYMGSNMDYAQHLVPSTCQSKAKFACVDKTQAQQSIASVDVVGAIYKTMADANAEVKVLETTVMIFYEVPADVELDKCMKAGKGAPKQVKSFVAKCENNMVNMYGYKKTGCKGQSNFQQLGSVQPWFNLFYVESCFTVA